MANVYDILIIGSGPAGLTAAIYAKRAQLSVLIVEKDYLGAGQITVTDRVDNYPGLYGISGYDLGEKFRGHAEQLGAEFFTGEAKEIRRDGKNWKVMFSDGSEKTAKAIVYAAGTSHRKLGVPGDDKRRISYCAVCDGAFYKGKTAAVIGGGDTALGDALHLSKLAEKVYLIHRRDEFRANRSLQKRVFDAENITPIMSAAVSEIAGEKSANGIVYVQCGETKRLDVDGVFVAVGSVPNSQLLRGICELDPSGYVIAGEDCRTSAEGIFAAGDVRTTPLRQVLTAAADGANAVISAERYIAGLE